MLIDRCFHASRSRPLILEPSSNSRTDPPLPILAKNKIGIPYPIGSGEDATPFRMECCAAGPERRLRMHFTQRIPLLALETETGSSIVRSLDRHPNYQPLLWFVSGQDRELLCSVKWRSSDESVIIPARTVGCADECAIADTIRGTQEDARYKKSR
jgi:hypothetical protein